MTSILLLKSQLSLSFRSISINFLFLFHSSIPLFSFSLNYPWGLLRDTSTSSILCLQFFFSFCMHSLSSVVNSPLPPSFSFHLTLLFSILDPSLSHFHPFDLSDPLLFRRTSDTLIFYAFPSGMCILERSF